MIQTGLFNIILAPFIAYWTIHLLIMKAKDKVEIVIGLLIVVCLATWGIYLL